MTRRHMPMDPAQRVERREYWRQQDLDNRTRDRLRWQYGWERADKIMAGDDEAANADAALWKSIGRKPS